jgi:hypothetical protein
MLCQSQGQERGRGADNVARLKRILLVATIVMLLLSCVVLLPCAQKIRDDEGWERSINRISQIALAMENYHGVFGKLPPAVVRAKDGRPLYSWRVLLLPFLEEDQLYERFHRDEPWDSPHNKALLKAPLRSYNPFGKDDLELTRYQVIIGPRTAFEKDGLTWDDFADGRANTLLVVEAGEPVPWSKPVDLTYDPSKPLPPLGAGFTRPVHFLCYEVWRKPGFVACFADGSGCFIPASTDEKTVRGFMTRNGGEKVDAASLR